MNIIQNQSLKKYNTFGIEASAKEFVAIQNEADLATILKENQQKKLFVLAGGSNMLLTKDIDALVLHINNKGIEVIDENDDFVWVKGQAGEVWHEFVVWCMERNFGGIENLSLIPGNVGATPVQNIGAYGVEIKDTFVSCEAMEIATQKTVTFTKEDCNFGYRESIFKGRLKNKYIILTVTFKLTKKNHKINTSYGAIDLELEKTGIINPTIQDVSNAVIAIRQSKLPDPKELGNSGSFFKNPVVPIEIYEKAKLDYPTIPHYPVSETTVKVPAGWLIEQAGFKGKRFGDAGIHAKQALVLVNYGHATGSEIWAVAQNIQQTVKEKFGISIEAEVNVI
ncbi:UDP-N-acetylmuramate dehydrogenase [Flavobacterium sp. 20NA77.7]|uniref:UDP-N-acetylenolpyruvoylglucosamine reductase n=1 Tax=Flavobacterium nakdongensis TaxID=3073563 RepID=A0ABY9RBM6_9FLAO|nr:UDP-N-acetylmuramate dehydrogenase [Flavobacterium sp. 20NA77.7]WMW78361.1 UDP-N-acetylmuramate dehydrogenase [Flavobacterium sp. 20NA77.7]